MKTSPSATPRRTRRQSAIAAALVLSMLHGQVVAAALSLPSVPIFLGTVVPPNLMFTLDDSGSMFWTWLPDAALSFSGNSNRYRFSQANGTIVNDNNVNNYPSYATTIGPNRGTRYGIFSAHCNGAFFNPNVTYTPPVDANGVQLPNAVYADAWLDGMRPGLGKINLSTNLRIHRDFDGGIYYQYTGAQPALGFTYTAAGAVQTGTTFYQECISEIGNNPGAGVFTLVNVNTTPAIQTNYA
ncbi:MAG: hypothetical protein Q8L92_11900, partial [Rubrivivax sp.]|nr:hypothetical protein [Rubrivivax sp.]